MFRFVPHRLFDKFRGMIDSLPPKAVLKAASLQRGMLNADLAMGRTPPSEDTDLILAFCRFIGGATHGALVMPPSISMEHLAFYQKTVERLAAAGELPGKAKTDFETVNHDLLFCISG